MGHAEPAEASERARYPRLSWIAQVEDERAIGAMVIGEQHAARRHLIFGMMRLYAFLIGGDARQHLAITGRCRVGVKHDQKVVALAFLVAAPDEQVMAGLVRGLSLGGRAERQTRE